jgi:hypothetical protein
VVYERVYHEAGAHTPMALSYGDVVRLIRGAGKEPVERDSFYRPVRQFAPDDPIFTPVATPAGSAPAEAELVQLVGTGRA